jgi:hypothetical protein
VDGEVTSPILGRNAASASTVALAALVVLGHFLQAIDVRTGVRYDGGMDELESLKGELEIERRSLAMLPPAAPIPKEKALELLRRCQAAIAAAQTRGRIG